MNAAKTDDGFRRAPTRIHGERARRLDQAKRAIAFHHEFLDDILRGIFPNDLVLLGASTGAGKTDIATGIARANARIGRAVHYFALEAEPDEIERRIKYTLLVELASKANHPRRDDLNYPDWIAGRCEEVCATFDQAADQIILDQFGRLNTYYRGEKFGNAEIERLFREVRAHTDLIILDHLHYVDVDDENENRGLRNTIQTIRSIAIDMGKPVILVAHLRKADQRARQLVPHIEDFHGSSDVIKIATQIVQVAPARSIEPAKWYLAPTFIYVPKDRRGGATGLVALCHYDRRFRAYTPGYTLGRLTEGGTKWEPLGIGDVPRWATRHRPWTAA